MSRTRHVLGMAKSSTNLKGSKGPRVELDFFKLAYAVGKIRAEGDEAQGYLLVMNRGIAATVTAWAAKYDAEDLVTVLIARLADEELEKLQAQQEEQAVAQAEATLGGSAGARSRADFGRDLGESQLQELIGEREIGVLCQHDSLPLSIRWDYYGTLSVP